MNTKNNVSTSLHWAFVGAVAALIGFLSARKVQMIWEFNLVLTIVIGLLITLCLGLIMYQPLELLRNIESSWNKALADSCQYLKERKEKRQAKIESEKATLLERKTGKHKWGYLRRAMYEKRIQIFERIQFFNSVLVGSSWVIALTWAICFFTEGLATTMMLGTGCAFQLLVFLVSFIISRDCESHYLKKLIPMFQNGSRIKWTVNLGFTHPIGISPLLFEKFLTKVRSHPDLRHLKWGLYLYHSKRPHTTWEEIYSYLIECEIDNFVRCFFPCVLYRRLGDLGKLLYKFVWKKVPDYATTLREWIGGVLGAILVGIKKFLAYIYCSLNTTARWAIFVCSIIGFFAGFFAEYLGASATAPFWCFGVGIVFGFVQKFVFRRVEDRLRAFLEKPSGLSGHAPC